MKTQPFYAVRVVVVDADAQHYQRDYVRGEMRVGKSHFDSWALGHMIRTVSAPGSTILEWRIQPVDYGNVVENRQYRHTTHQETSRPV
jgi:hypothetical protein